MGLLVEGTPLTAEELKAHLTYIREHGIEQFLNSWRNSKDVQNDELRFGDEIESGIFVINEEEKTIRLTIRAEDVRNILIEKEDEYLHESEGCTWHPEFGAWMIESTPSRPYSNYASDLLRVERNMVLRRRRLFSALHSNEIAPTVVNFPLLGTPNSIFNEQAFETPYSHSAFVPDYIINNHPRFAALVTNIRARRRSKVDIQIPLYKDINTPEFQTEGTEKEATTEPSIYMDAMAFGMGMCCLQVTFQARDMDESRYMYDQLTVLAPIMLAMTAACPIFKGRVADTDARWSTIAQSVDDRNPVERGVASEGSDLYESIKDSRSAGDSIKRIPKSRYDSVSRYIFHNTTNAPYSACHKSIEQFNDIDCPIDEGVKARLISEGVDSTLAHHMAHLFIRDPLVAFHGQIQELDDNISRDHFESIQSTNWQTCRWKPPPPKSADGESPHIGWRTEFRSMEVQLTDFENAAFTVFVVLVTRVVLAFDLAFYIPLSQVDENMKRAHKRDAVRSQMFWFRCRLQCGNMDDLITETDLKEENNSKEISEADSKEQNSPKESQTECCEGANASTSEDGAAGKLNFSEEMTMEEIFCGKDSYYPGLLPLVFAYLDFIQCDTETYKRVSQYLSYIEQRAKGNLITAATWMRQFVDAHPHYRHDSVVTAEIVLDLMKACDAIGKGSMACPEVLGNAKIIPIRKEDAYGHRLMGRLSKGDKSSLIKTLMSRAAPRESDKAARQRWRSDSTSEPPKLDLGISVTGP